MEPSFQEQILDLKGKGKRIFLDSMGDWFSPGVRTEWLDETIEAVRQKPEHIFLVLTKRPDLINLTYIPHNTWLGTSITNQNDVLRLDKLREKVHNHRFISFEPLHGFIEADLRGIDWVIIGAETGTRKGKIRPEPEWIEAIRKNAEKLGIPLFFKDNLRPYALPGYHPQQFPMGV